MPPQPNRRTNKAMDQDKVKLLITKQSGKTVEIDEFVSYSMDSDLFQAGDAFEIVVAAIGPGPGPVDVERGDSIKIFINDSLELTAIANRPQRGYRRNTGGIITIRGVDYMDLLTGHYIEEDQVFNNVSTEDIVEALVGPVPFINRSAFRIHAGAKTETKPQTETSLFGIRAKSQKAAFKAKAGETVFDALRRFALSKGVLFYNLPNGTFVLGGLITTGTPSFFLNVANIDVMSEKEDPGQAYSKVVIFAQQQNTQALFEPLTQADVVKRAEAIDENFPYFKPFVARSNQSGTEEDLKKQAELKLAEFKAAELGLNYTVAGHSQGQGAGRRTWQTNMIARLDDPKFPKLDGDYLIAGRQFKMDKEAGTTTQVRLTQIGFSPTI